MDGRETAATRCVNGITWTGELETIVDASRNERSVRAWNIVGIYVLPAIALAPAARRKRVSRSLHSRKMPL
jgi:hypothetical protein